MPNTRYIATALIVLVLLVAGWYIFSQPKIVEGEPIKIGAVLPMTGVAANYGENQRNAMQMAIDEINAGGGVLGRPLTIVLEDDGTDPKKTVSAFQKLASVD